MLVDPIGYRFSPTGEELVNDYLKNKNLGKIWLVDNAIGEINICSFEPKDLPSLTKINSDNLVWYFFSPIVYANAKKTTIKRTAGNGFWKVTGPDRTIKDKRGSKIGIKKTLVYHEGKGTNGVRTPWVMHEYHITCLPSHLTTYVLCQVKYKGDHTDSSYGGSSSVVSQSNTVRVINTTVPEVEVDQPDEDGFSLNELSIPLNVEEDLPVDAINPNLLQQIPEVQIEQPLENGMFLEEFERLVNEQEDLLPMYAIDPNMYFNEDNPNLLQQTPYNNDGWINNLLAFNGGNFDVICDQVIMHENRNVYMPRKALSGIIVDCGSDSDDCAESIYATSYQGTPSPHDSVSGSFKDFPCCSCTDSYNDPQTFEYLSVSRMSREDQPTRRNVPSKQEVKRATTIEKAEKKGWFILEEAMETNHKPWYVYLMNMITGFIILMDFVANIRL